MKVYGKSDRGSVRPTNQDAYVSDLRAEERVALLAVCDGMGGANAGNVASRFAIESFMGVLRQQVCAEMSAQQMQQALSDGVAEANRVVFELASAQPEFRGMGTTLVGAIATDDAITLVNVGDSRAYCVSKDKAQRLTEDHSYVEEMMRRGKLSEEAARVHPNKNLITRAIGVEPQVDCDLYDVSLAAGDVLLLCSDGLTGMLRDEQIAEIVYQAADLEAAADKLIVRALEEGGTDNITVLLFTRETPEGEE